MERGTSGLVKARRVDVRAVAADLAPLIATYRDELEQGRRMPLPLVDAWRQSGVLRLLLPVELGGEEGGPEPVLDLVEAVAAMDGSVAWNLLIDVCSSMFAAYLPEAGAEAIWGRSPDTIVVGCFAPTGRAVPVDGGYQVSGRWSFVSGIQHADWFCGNCLVLDGERPRIGPDGEPEMRLVFVPASAGTVEDTWHSGGMRGTGSHDFAIPGTFVPEGRWFDVFRDRGRIQRPLYRLAFIQTWFGPGVASLALGIARHAIDALVETARNKVSTRSRKPLTDSPLAQIQVARAEAIVCSARSFLRQAVNDVWDRLEAGGEPSELEQTRLTLARVHATESAVQAVDLMYKAAGGAAVYSSSPLDRCLRDIHVAAQHLIVGDHRYQEIGQFLLRGQSRHG